MTSCGDRVGVFFFQAEDGIRDTCGADGNTGIGDCQPGAQLRARGACPRAAVTEKVNVYVFTGPTLSAMEAREELQANYLPPAAQGDVYRVAKTQPKAIGIIDGYFERLPAVWHKEILWAMQE